MKQAFKKFTLVAFVMIVGIMSYAQVTTSSVSGLITEPDGAPLAGVTVVALHTPSGTSYYATSDNSGNYRIANMRVGGPYTVSMNLIGFRKVETTEVSIALADNYVINAVMQEEAIGLNEIVISAESVTSNMRSDRAGAITSMDMKAINNIPTVTRSLNDVLKMTPQLYVSSSGLQIGGGNYRQSFVTIDGAAFNNAFGIGQNLPANGSPVSLDALEQISVSITPYDVRQSGFVGGSINAVTRSGSNEFRGTAYTYYNNQSFRGNKVGDHTLNVSDSKYQVYGASIGGAIIKNKLFYFVNAEIENSVSPGPSKIASSEENPFNMENNVARPSETTMNKISEYLKGTYGYNPGAYMGYSSDSPGMKILARLDWNIHRDHKLNLRYTNTKTKSPTAPSTSVSGLRDRNFATGYRTDMYAIYFQNARYYQETNFSSFTAELNSRFFGGRLNNILRASYSHQYEPRSTEGGEFPFVDIAVEEHFYTSFGTELFSYGNLRDVRTFNITDELSWNIGKHNLLGGLQFENNLTQNGFQRFGAGYYSFSFDDEQSLISAIDNGTVFNNPGQFAITHSMRNDFAQVFPSFKFNQFSLYLQDEISASERFKILAGIRVELPFYPSLNTYNEQVANTTLSDYNGNGGKYNTSQLPSTKAMFSPRIGFNWDITGNRSIVLRGGTGLFTGRIPFVWIVAQAGDSGVLQTTYTADGSTGTITAFTTDRLNMLKEIYPNGLNAATVNISSVSLMADDLKMPQAWKSSLALDMRLPGGILGSIEGIYNKDINPVTITNVGLTDPVATNISGYADNRLYYGQRYDGTLRDAYLLHNISTDGYYYSVTAKVEKNNWHGLSAMLAYTHSAAKSLNEGWGDQMYSAYQNSATVNGQNAKEMGYASYVMPHRLIGSLSYRKEYGKHFATSVSLFYEGGPQGRNSFTYTSNILGDGGSYNLIYVPEKQDELIFADYDYVTDDVTYTYTAADQATDFWNFVNNDKYLKTRKGKYAERSGLIYPWTNQFDIKIAQDFFVNVKGKRNTIQVGLDILNLGNLLNKNWGHKYEPNQNAILKQVGSLSQGSTVQPVYNFVKNGPDVLKDTFRSYNSFSSTYYMQFSLRYIFN